MVDDPHKVLGVSPGATQEEIKRAYRQKAKECHPDLHPNDPNADERMNEVNEAYDMLMHPDKYAQRRAQQQAQQGYGNPYGQQYGGQSYGNPYGQQYGGQQYGNPYGQRQQGSYYGGFGGFGGFDDFFGFGGSGYANAGQPPQEMPGDSPQIRQVIADIRMRQYQAALTRLQNIPSTGRNARWYYLSGVANHGAGNTIMAIEHMQRASQMEPNNALYHTLLNQYRRAGQTYESNSHGFDMRSMDPSRLCWTLCLINMFCPYCRYGMFCC